MGGTDSTINKLNKEQIMGGDGGDGVMKNGVGKDGGLGGEGEGEGAVMSGEGVLTLSIDSNITDSQKEVGILDIFLIILFCFLLILLILYHIILLKLNS